MAQGTLSKPSMDSQYQCTFVQFLRKDYMTNGAIRIFIRAKYFTYLLQAQNNLLSFIKKLLNFLCIGVGHDGCHSGRISQEQEAVSSE